jgi:hypothetical protein
MVDRAGVIRDERKRQAVRRVTEQHANERIGQCHPPSHSTQAGGGRRGIEIASRVHRLNTEGVEGRSHLVVPDVWIGLCPPGRVDAAYPGEGPLGYHGELNRFS